ncbi:MAG: glycerol-3-phosphate dehydrogenase/oxidase [Saprospiraceae bacterium]
MNPKATYDREAIKRTFGRQDFDLLIIGGGITGAGIALDAALRGMSVALVEKGDFASGTSSRSTKLIHGGLRYLKQMEFRLVSEVGRERAILHRLAPHLVLPEKMLLPIVKGGTLGRFSASLGLWLYDRLAGVNPEDRKKMLGAAQCLTLEPLLKKEGLLGGGHYAEYRTDDARLTLEVVKSAIRHGALCLNYMAFQKFHYSHGSISGARCQDTCTGEEFDVRAEYVVNAAGPWVDKLRKEAHALTGKRLFLSKGVHIVVSKQRFPLQQAVYFDVPDGRMMFAIPRHRCSYIGTTDTPFKGEIERVYAEKKDVEYILKGVNYMFPSSKLSHRDVESTWAGLRPLIYEKGKSASEISRRDEVFIAANGLVSMAGGKLTGYRKMAERVVNILAKKISKKQGRKFGKCLTHDEALSDKPFPGMKEVAAFEADMKGKYPTVSEPDCTIPALVEAFGSDAATILAGASTVPLSDHSLLKSELAFCFANEMLVKPLDFLERRTGWLYFDIEKMERGKESVLEEFSHRFGWTAKQLQDERATVEQAIRHAKVLDC